MIYLSTNRKCVRLANHRRCSKSSRNRTLNVIGYCNTNTQSI